MQNWQAFIFDFDGVLVDSVEVKTRAFAKLYEPYGKRIVDLVIEHHRNNGGMNRFDKFRYYHSEFLERPLNDQGVMDLAEAFSRIVIDEVIASPEIPGARIFLKECSPAIPCFINSATPENELREIVFQRKLTPFITDIFGAPRSKTDNMGIILNQYNLDNKRCLFFGDALSDYKAAIAHDVEFVGIVPDEEAPLLKSTSGIIWKRDFNEVGRWLNLFKHNEA